MRKIILAAASIIGIAASSNAMAQTPDVNCAALRGTPLMCIKNASTVPVVAIQATATQAVNPASWINIPGGPISPGGTSIVRFEPFQGGCNQFVVIRLMDGNVRTFPNVNVCNSTSFTIRW